MSGPRSIARLAALSASLVVLTLAPAASAPAQSLDTVDIGCVSHARFDRLFTAGAVIPHLTPDWYVPQGLTAWNKHNWLIVSYYYPHDDPDVPGGPREAVIVMIDRANGNVAKTLRLSGMTGHAGGIAIGKGYLWVASEDGVYRYDAGRLESTASGGAIAGRRFDLDYDAAYLTFAGGDLWVGDFVMTGKGGMRRYGIGSTGNLLTEEPEVTITTPPARPGRRRQAAVLRLQHVVRPWQLEPPRHHDALRCHPAHHDRARDGGGRRDRRRRQVLRRLRVGRSNLHAPIRGRDAAVHAPDGADPAHARLQPEAMTS